MSVATRFPCAPATWRLCLPLLCFVSLMAAENTPPQTESDKDEIIQAPAKADPAAEKFWAAVRLLQSQKQTDVAEGRSALQTVADHEYTHAQVLLGNCLVSGSYGFTKSARKAVSLFRLAAERGNAFAKVSLGSCYATGTGVRKDDDKAAEWLAAALAPEADFSQPERPVPPPGAAEDRSGGVAGELGNDPVSESQATAHFLLGQILGRQGKNAEAQAHYIAAATAGVDGRSGIYGAATQAALNYAFGQGTPRDLIKANEMLDRSRKLIARQQVSLIHNYVSLKMVDEFAVADLEEQAGETGATQQSNLQVSIAAILGDKKSKDYNASEAVKWYELAAENGQVWAMLQLGLIYSKGELGRPDPAKAFAWFEKAGGDKPKHYLGIANLAICLQNGLGVAKDTAKAAALFQKYRDADIVCYLGSIGQCPAAALSFEEETELNLSWARQKNDAHAQYLLGVRYLYGWGVKADRDDAMKWLQKAGKANHGGALCQLGFIAENTLSLTYAGHRFPSLEDLKRAVDYYRQGSAAGNADATANYANMLAAGRGIAKDQALAEATYQKCLQVDPGHARAHCNLGALYADKLRLVADTIDDDRIRETRRLMLQHYEESTRLEFPYAARNLADIYYEGKLLPRDLAKAYRCYEQASDWGLPEAHYNLGYMHEHGEGVPVTYAEAAYHYRLAALEGHPQALSRLVDFYLTGTGVSFDLDRALFWLQQMVRRGNLQVLPSACDIMLKREDYANLIPLLRQLSESPNNFLAGYAYDRLSLCYAHGLGVKANTSRAEKYTNEAVKRGNGTALNNLARQQMKQGRTAEALVTFLRAAHTSPDAAFALGQMHYFGTHVTQDKDKALKCFKIAAAGNQIEALYFLAALTYNGEVGAPSLDQAIHYARQAENQGHAKAATLREKLELRLKNKEAPPEEATRARSL